MFRALLLFVALPAALMAQGVFRPTVAPIVVFIILGAVSLAPFLAIMTTSFIKVSVVLSLLRNGLGTQQVPSGLVIGGLSIVLTMFIMAPVAGQMADAAHIKDGGRQILNSESLDPFLKAIDDGKEPLRTFLLRHAHPQDRALFLYLAQRLENANRNPRTSPAPLQLNPNQGQADQAQIGPLGGAQPVPGSSASNVTVSADREFRIVLPAFITSELKTAFQIGFLILLPFLVIDVIVANVLIAVGLQMVQPAIVSLPLKILLFVVADGWYLIVKGLVLSYA